ncbi:MAG: BrnA antitoxin family protein [Rhodobacteraceae bacterium]|nr:BrnA antitoxin family protein [Paracoccaceae bacterium]
MPTKAQDTAHANLVYELKRLQSDFQQHWVKGSLPQGWNEIPLLHPVAPQKSEITLSLDDDMLKWFRKFGTGFEARINSILRIYWHALQSGLVKSHWDAEAAGPKDYSLIEDMLKLKLKDLRSGENAQTGEVADLAEEVERSLSLIRKAHDGGAI